MRCLPRSFALAARLAAFGRVPGHVASAPFETNAGVLGSDRAVSNRASPAYIATTTDGTGANPGSTARVATCAVTFPAASTHNLNRTTLPGL